MQEALLCEPSRVPRVVRRPHADKAMRGRHDGPFRRCPKEAVVLRRGRCQVGAAVPSELRYMPVTKETFTSVKVHFSEKKVLLSPKKYYLLQNQLDPLDTPPHSQPRALRHTTVLSNIMPL